MLHAKNAQKTFNIQDKLIPEGGRLLQCGSCNYKWFFKIPIELTKRESESEISNNTKIKISKPIKAKEQETKTKINDNQVILDSPKKSKKKPKLIKNSLVFCNFSNCIHYFYRYILKFNWIIICRGQL